MKILIHRDTAAWHLQVWLSFAIAAFLCGVGLLWLPGTDLDRVFMVMGYFFCLSNVFVLSKFVRDNEKSRAEGKRANTPLFRYVVWSGFLLAMALTAWGLLRMEINGSYKAFLGVGWLYLVSSAFTLAKYNLVSYAWGDKYQQSNQWAIETLAAAMAPGSAASVSRRQAQAWPQERGYRPATLTLGPLTRLGGRIGSANIAFDDHPPERRFSSRIDTVTVDSVFAWFQRSGMGQNPVSLDITTSLKGRP